MKRAQIYLLLDPANISGRGYVGRTFRTIHKRRLQHIAANSLNRDNTKKNAWLKSLLVRGVEPEALLLEETHEWQEAEMFYIAYFTSIGLPLVNGTAGGDGILSPSAETREKISRSRKGKRNSPEAIEKFRQKMIGRVPTEKARENMRKAQVGRVRDPESAKWASLMRFGQKRTPEAKERMRQAQLGKKASPEAVAKRVAKAIGSRRTEETRKRMSEAQRRPEVIAAKAAKTIGQKRSEEMKKRMSQAQRRPDVQARKRETMLATFAARKAASASIPPAISEQPKEEAMKRTTILPSGASHETSGTPEEFALYDRELMKQMVALLHDEDEEATDTEPKEADETN